MKRADLVANHPFFGASHCSHRRRLCACWKMFHVARLRLLVLPFVARLSGARISLHWSHLSSTAVEIDRVAVEVVVVVAEAD